MKHELSMNSNKYITFYLLFSTSVLFLVEGRSIPIPPVSTSESQTASSQVAPEARQGILEIPKQAATAIRNFLDQGIRYYLGVTTPPPSPNLPPELQNSIVGNFLLGNLHATLPPAPAYNPQLPGQLTVVQPITVSKDPSYYGHSPTVVFVKKTTPAPVEPPKTEASPPPPASAPHGSKNKQRVRPTSTGEKVHILDTDTSFNAIFNGLQVSGGVVPKLPPPSLTSAEAPEPAPVAKPVDTIEKYKPASTVDKVHVHVLDTDTTLDGIYSMFGLQLSSNPKPKPPQEEVPATIEATTEAVVVIEAIPEKTTDETKKKPIKYNPNAQFIETDSFLSNPYGITVNKNPDDEALYVPETTKASIIIPIQTSTSKGPVKASTTEQSSVEGAIVVIPEEPVETTTEEGAVEATTEDEDEEGLREVDGASTTKVPGTTPTVKPVTGESAVETTTEDEDEEGLGEEDGENKDITTKASVTTTTKQVTGEVTVETATEDDEEEGRGDEDGSKRKYIFDILE